MAYLVEGQDQIAQGSVLNGVNWGYEQNPLSIVLSNECDIVNDKASFIIVAALVPAKDTIVASKEYESQIQGIENGEISKSKWKSVKTFLDNYIYNKGITRYYFIDPKDAIEVPYLFVDFQHIKSVPIEDLPSIEVVAELPSPFKEQMMVQFASYTARIPVSREEDTNSIAEAIVYPLVRKQ